MQNLLSYNWFWLLVMGAITVILVTLAGIGLALLGSVAKSLERLVEIISGFLERIERIERMRMLGEDEVR